MVLFFGSWSLIKIYSVVYNMFWLVVFCGILNCKKFGEYKLKYKLLFNKWRVNLFGSRNLFENINIGGVGSVNLVI